MTAALGFLALLAGAQLLVDDVVVLTGDQRRGIRIPVQVRPAVVECQYSVVSGQTRARVLLLSAAEFGRLRGGGEYKVLSATAPGEKGQLRYRVGRPSDYHLVLDGRSPPGQKARVHIRATVEEDLAASFTPRTLDASLRRRTIVFSLGSFGLIAAWALWRLADALERRRAARPR